MDCSSPLDFLDGEFLTACVIALSFLGTAVGYLMERRQERREAKQAGRRAEAELNRQQALGRVRNQLSLYVGPLHRLWKTFNTIILQYIKSSGKNIDHMLAAVRNKGRAYWNSTFTAEQLQPYIDDPMSLEARHYRGMVARRLKPVYTRIREIVLKHASDLADLPTQEEWLQKYSRESVMSPYVGSVNVNVIFDTFTAWTFEFDDIIEAWGKGDFSRMQPSTKVALAICNDIVDTLYDEAKAKEATYNKHVKIHKNKMQGGLPTDLLENMFDLKPKDTLPGRRVSMVGQILARGAVAKENDTLQDSSNDV